MIIIKNDLTKGSPLKLIISFSIPLILGNFFQQLYNMADGVIVGRTLGLDALAAVGSTSSLSFFITGFAIGLMQGFTVITAQKFGAKNEAETRKSIAASIILSVIFAILLTSVALVFLKPFLHLMKTPENIFDDTYSYIFVIFSGLTAIIFYNLFACILRALGDSKTPLLFLVTSCLLNIVLDFVFILNFKTGVAGAGYATVISQLISAVLCFLYSMKKFPILRLKKSDWKVSASFLTAHIKMGIPMALQYSITAIGALVVQSSVNSLGSTIVAAVSTSSKIEQFVATVLSSLGATMATYTAQNYGAGEYNRIKTGVKKGTFLALGVAIFGAVVLVTFCPILVNLLAGSDADKIQELVFKFITITAPNYLILSIIFVYRNTLQGMGKTTVPVLCGLFELIARAAVASLLVNYLGYTAICIAGPAAWYSAGIPLFITYVILMKKRYKTAFKIS